MRRAWWLAAVVALAVAGWFVWRTAAPTGTGRTTGIEGGADDAAATDRGVDGVGPRLQDSAARRVRAHLVDEFGEPLAGGRVSLRCLVDDEVTAIPGGAWALDESGSFEAPGCLGLVCVELHHPFAVQSEPWVLTSGEPAVLRSTGLPRLHGTVVDGRGAPIVAARITVRPRPDDDPMGIVPTIGTTTTTDVDGAFSFALVRRAPCDPCTEADRGCDAPPLALHHTVVVGVHAPLFAPVRVEVEVDPEDGDLELPVIRLSPPADVLSGTLLDAAGDPYPRATVIARASDDPTEQHQTAVAGDTFAFESLGAGPYDLRALQDGVELATSERVRPGDDVALLGRTIARGPDIVLEVTDDGELRAGVDVDGGPFRGARTDLRGEVVQGAAMPGDYVLSLRPPGGSLVRRSITIPAPTDAAGSPAHGRPAGPINTSPGASAGTPPGAPLRLRVELDESAGHLHP